jgi:hypothetical protein
MQAAAWLEAGLSLPAMALKVGQEDYWLDQIARDRGEYFSGYGESAGRYVGAAAATWPDWLAEAERLLVPVLRAADPEAPMWA